MTKRFLSASLFLLLALVMAFGAGRSFLRMREPEPIGKGPGVTGVIPLSRYFPALAGTQGDTDIYVLEGEEPGGAALVLGGTHANEPAGYLTAVVLIENATVERGTLYVIPRSNNSAFTHNSAQEASPQYLSFSTAKGRERVFRYGSRATNPLHQWPDPDVYIHAASGQQLSGSETRNLNRGYPGRPDGTFTEKVCYGITNLIKEEKIDLTIDLHEASPEYPVINAMVAHDRAMPIAADVAINMQMEGINIGLEPSPVNLRGLTHRELGDATETLAVLMETANAAQGRLRGRTDEALALTGVDPMYERAAELGRLFVPYDAGGHPIEQRVARHLTGISELFKSLSGYNETKAINVRGIPSYEVMNEKGLGAFLLPMP